MDVTFEGKTRVTVEQLAEMFCSLGSDDQARFFQEVYDEARTWKGGCGQMQWLRVRTDADRLGLAGAIEVMRDLAFPWTLFSLWGDDFLEQRFARGEVE